MERRKAERQILSGDTEFSYYDSANVRRTAFLTDTSEAGVGMITTFPVKSDEQIMIREGFLQNRVAQIRWTTKYGEQDVYRSGLEFMEK